jgi:shikimate kinase
MRIYLIGFMGSGKTTVGRLLAPKLVAKFPTKLPNCVFVDLDHYIEQQQGLTVAEIFAKPGDEGGEAYFRELERKYLNEVMTKFPNAVISTGGGTPCFNDNMERMNADGVTVYLKYSPEMLARRLGTSRGVRPLLAGKSQEELLAYVKETLSEREVYYNQANVVVAEPSKDMERLVRILEPYFE